MVEKQHIAGGSVKPHGGFRKRPDGSPVISPAKIKIGDKVKCEWCGNEFTADKDNQNLCSNKCGAEVQMMTKTAQKPSTQKHPFEQSIGKMLDLVNIVHGAMQWGRIGPASIFLGDLIAEAEGIKKHIDKMAEAQTSSNIEEIKKKRLEALKKGENDKSGSSED